MPVTRRPPHSPGRAVFPASGASVGLASAQGGLSSIPSAAAWLSNAGALDGDCLQDLGEALPAEAPPVPSTPSEPLKRACHGPVEEAMEGVGVAMDSRVAVVTSQPSREAVEEGVPRHMPIGLNPCLVRWHARCRCLRAVRRLTRGTPCRSSFQKHSKPKQVNRRVMPGCKRLKRKMRVFSGATSSWHFPSRFGSAW